MTQVDLQKLLGRPVSHRELEIFQGSNVAPHHAHIVARIKTAIVAKAVERRSPLTEPAARRTPTPAKRTSPPKPQDRSKPCVHLGPLIRLADGAVETAECKSCAAKGKVFNVPVHACKLHGKCTIDKNSKTMPCCRVNCKDYSNGQPHQLTVDANGIGDVLLGMTVGAGWKARHIGSPLHMYVRHLQWAELFNGAYDTVGIKAASETTAIAADLNNRGGLHFVEAVTRIPLAERKRPTLKPLPADVVAWAKAYQGVIVLVPLSLGSGAGRNWILPHWRALEQMLCRHGSRTVIIGTGTNTRELTGFQGEVICGKPARFVAGLMKVAACVVSNESGMGHLGGAVGTPTVVLAAQLEAAPIYAVWPTVQVIQGPMACGGCRWTGPNYKGDCPSVCANLQAITPESVFAVVKKKVAVASRFACDAAVNAEIARHVARLDVPHPSGRRADRKATMTAFLHHLSCKHPSVVETGCQRADNDYGAGMSTTIFGILLKSNGGKLTSLDNSESNVAFCRSRTQQLPVDVVLTDSRPWLKNYKGAPIDGLYLDSMDTEVTGYQDCCLEEAQAATPHLAPNAAILIDDTFAVNGGWEGKGAKAVPWLVSCGWCVVCEGYQVLLLRSI